MALLHCQNSSGYPAFKEAECVAAGEKLASAYQNAEPFPHIVIDDFLSKDALKPVIGSFPDRSTARAFDRDQERLKYQYHPESIADPYAKQLVYALNSQPMLGFLSAMTGIDGLIADPYFAGGGLHQTMRGGHLGIHADFNRHKIMNVRRRLNLLVYLNENWQESYGGSLELWSKDMKECCHSVKPEIGTAVIFSTDLDSYHGHPDPLTCPDDVSRKSIATYYYTAQSELTDQPDRTTNFKTRPGTQDRLDVGTKVRHAVNDWTPPALRRLLARTK